MAEHANSTTVPSAHFPAQHLLPPVDRFHLEAVVDRLGAYYERYARHKRRAEAALERIERLRQSAIHALDFIDGDPDFEDSDEDAQCDDEGADEEDNDTSDYEPSLCGIHMSGAVAQGAFNGGEVHHDLEADSAHPTAGFFGG